MNPFEPSESAEPSESIEGSPTENLSGVFVWITMGALLLGSLPYLYPSGST